MFQWAWLALLLCLATAPPRSSLGHGAHSGGNRAQAPSCLTRAKLSRSRFFWARGSFLLRLGVAPLVPGKAPAHVSLGHGAHSCFAVARGRLRRQRTWAPSYFSGKGTPTHTYGSLLLPPTRASLILTPGNAPSNALPGHRAHSYLAGARCPLRLWLGSSTPQFGEQHA